MARRGPKKAKGSPAPRGVEPLRSQNIMVNGHRTSMRLEPSMWEALDEIATREGMTINDICSRIKTRLDEQQRTREGAKPQSSGGYRLPSEPGAPPAEPAPAESDSAAKASDITLTAAVRTFIVSYFRVASTDQGHALAGHGSGDPFVNTPFNGSQEGGPSSTGGGSKFSGSKMSAIGEMASSQL